MAEAELMTLEEAKTAALTKAFGDKTNELVLIDEELEKANLQAYNDKVKLQKPIFEKRNALIKTIPGFWLQAMTNDEDLKNLVDPIDRDALKHVTELALDHDAEDARQFSVSFHFSQDNPYFSDRVLTKKFTLAPTPEGQRPSYELGASLDTEAVPIKWASEKHNLVTKKPRVDVSELEEFDEFDGAAGSFFNWFVDDKDTFGIHEMILELYANAIETYAGILDLGDTDDEDDLEEESDGDPKEVVDLEVESDDEKPKKKKQKQ